MFVTLFAGLNGSLLTDEFDIALYRQSGGPGVVTEDQ